MSFAQWVDPAVQTLPVERFWGVGPKTARKLRFRRCPRES